MLITIYCDRVWLNTIDTTAPQAHAARAYHTVVRRSAHKSAVAVAALSLSLQPCQLNPNPKALQLPGIQLQRLLTDYYLHFARDNAAAGLRALRLVASI